jgi:hypothetical protein
MADATLFDHAHDPQGREWHRLSKLYSAPAFVTAYLAGESEKTAETILQPSRPPVNVYGDPVRRLFPCKTAAETWLSSLFFTEKRSEYTTKEASWVDERLAKSASHFGIKAHCDAIRVRHTELYKDASDQLPDSQFAYVWVDEATGAKTRRMPLRNVNEVKAAADWFLQYRDSFAFNDRHVVADKILKRATDLGTDLEDAYEPLEQHACRGMSTGKHVAAAIRTRARLAKESATRERLTKLADATENLPSLAVNRDMQFKIAQVLDEVDKAIGLSGRYTENILRPEEACFGVTITKVAEWRDSHCATTTGSIYAMKDFERVPLDDLHAVFGDDIVDAVRSGLHVDPEKMAEVAATLPQPDAHLFDQLLRDSGIFPVIKQAAYRPVGFSTEQLKKLAEVQAPV